MITKEEIDRLVKMHESVRNHGKVGKDDIIFVTELNRKAKQIEYECIDVLETMRKW